MQNNCSQEIYSFKVPMQHDLFVKLSKELRCIVCQNQSVFDSKAPIVLSLRSELYHQILAGKQENEILEFVVARYGDAIVYQPPFNKATAVLWGAPLFMVLAAILVFFNYIVLNATKQS